MPTITRHLTRQLKSVSDIAQDACENVEFRHMGHDPWVCFGITVGVCLVFLLIYFGFDHFLKKRSSNKKKIKRTDSLMLEIVNEFESERVQSGTLEKRNLYMKRDPTILENA